MNANREVERAAREIASALVRILQSVVGEATKSVSKLAAAAAAEAAPAKDRKTQQWAQSAPPGWATKKHLAKHIGVSMRTISSWMASGRIPFIRIGRTDLQLVDERLRRSQRSDW